MDDARIKARVAARERAAAIMELAVLECVEHVDVPLQDAFWDFIRKGLPESTRPESVGRAEAKSTPMTNNEARAFGATVMPFGEYKDMRVDDVPLDRLRWYADQTQFQKDLQRYLKSRRVQQEDE